MFENIYFKSHWGNWHIAASGIPGVLPTQNGIEAGHRVQKMVISTDGLRADTTIFLNTSAPKILAQTGNKAPLTLEDVTYNAKGPFVVEVVVKSQKLLSVPVPHYEGPVCEITGERCFVINSGSGADDIGDMTRTRAMNFLKSIDGSLVLPKGATLEVLKKILAKTHSCHRVTARPVALKDANPFMRTLTRLNGIAGADSGDEDDSWCFVCDCGSFLHNGNLCSHIGACAHTVGAVDLDVLITQLGGRKLPGRPRKNFGGPLDRVKPAAASKYHSAKWYSELIEKKGPLWVHKHRTVRLFGEEGMAHTGKVRRYRENGGNGLKKHGLWEIFYEDDDPYDNTEELTLDELCEALSRASRLGMPGCAPADLIQQVV
mmetsp:Transcript_36715/g.86243  ORF Transcript_36715/g.86243 Transcript_36715/m.86243 type:complete len:374 (-) Transcript_36715:788-1909(-)